MLANSFFCAVKKHYPSIANGRLDSLFLQRIGEYNRISWFVSIAVWQINLGEPFKIINGDNAQFSRHQSFNI
jgi:hypothetical protein